MNKRSSIAFFSLYIFATSSLLVGCSDRDEDLSKRPVNITFQTEVTETRAANLWSNDGLNGTTQFSHFGVFAYRDGTSRLMGTATEGLLVTRVGTDNKWQCATLLWPANAYIDFYAYSPTTQGIRSSGPAAGRGGFVILPGTYPSIDLVVDGYAEHQMDLLISTAQRYQTKRDFITLPLRHILTGIIFSARIDDDLAQYAPEVTVRVDKIALKNIHNHGTHYLDARDNWIVDLANPTYKRDFILERTSTQGSTTPELINEDISTSYRLISTKSGTLMMLPQLMDDEKELEVTYRIIVPGREDALRTYSVSLATQSPDWGQGTNINYQLLLRNRAIILTIFGLPGSP